MAKQTQTIHDKLRVPNGKIYLTEILKEVSRAKTEEEKIDLLTKFVKRGNEYETMMRFFIEIVYHPAVVWELPEGVPPYNPNTEAKDPSMAAKTLFTAVKDLRMFLRGTSSLIKEQVKRERVFIQILETLEAQEARLVLMMKAKRLNGQVYPQVKREHFTKAFPQWLPEELFTTKNA